MIETIFHYLLFKFFLIFTTNFIVTGKTCNNEYPHKSNYFWENHNLSISIKDIGES